MVYLTVWKLVTQQLLLIKFFVKHSCCTKSTWACCDLDAAVVIVGDTKKPPSYRPSWRAESQCSFLLAQMRSLEYDLAAFFFSPGRKHFSSIRQERGECWRRFPPKIPSGHCSLKWVFVQSGGRRAAGVNACSNFTTRRGRNQRGKLYFVSGVKLIVRWSEWVDVGWTWQGSQRWLRNHKKILIASSLFLLHALTKARSKTSCE